LYTIKTIAKNTIYPFETQLHVYWTDSSEYPIDLCAKAREGWAEIINNYIKIMEE